MKRAALASTVLAALATPLYAQTQQVKPPIAVYWLSAETNAGMGMTLPAGMAGMMPPGMQGGKRLKLDLGSSQSASGEPRANHAIPPALAMGPSLPLLTPQVQRAQSVPGESGDPRFEPPRGRMLIYWGCGEAVRAGQPVVIDFSKLGTSEAAAAIRSRSVSRPTGPAAGRNRTYGEWPNRESGTAVPEQASLMGDHTVSGNYAPDIRFTVGDRYDFLAPVAFESTSKTPAGAFRVRWQAIPRALGYFATAMGSEGSNDVVMWSSSEVQEMGHALMDYLPPAEVQRLVRDKVVMAQQTTECTVPAGFFKNEGAMFNFIAYGEELNVVHPPRPKDPRQVWEQQYAVKLRLKSTGMTMLSEGGMGGRARAASPAADTAEQAQESRVPQTPARPSGTGEALEQGINVLRGIFGR
ncbi:MAG: hypothetical protein ACXWUB_06525 [Burkholderiales bacterium]